MTALLLMLTLSAGAPICYAPRDAQAGWKHVSLPPDAPALAAPDDIDQFRSDDPVDMVIDHPEIFLSGTNYHEGRTSFELNAGGGPCHLEVDFKEPLRGAKVDVLAWGPNGNMSLKREERVPGSRLELAWGDVSARAVTIIVHNHLREDPVIESWRSVCRVEGAKLPVGDAYRLGRSLYYYQPRGGRVPLCNRPDALLRVNVSTLPAGVLPVSTALDRT